MKMKDLQIDIHNEDAVIKANEFIAEFYDGTIKLYSANTCVTTHVSIYEPRLMQFHCSWDWLMPVIRNIVELCHAVDGDDLFMSDEYTSILDTVPLALIEDAYKVTIEFIEFYNKLN